MNAWETGTRRTRPVQRQMVEAKSQVGQIVIQTRTWTRPESSSGLAPIPLMSTSRSVRDFGEVLSAPKGQCPNTDSR
jgi:hypothetical protein